MRCPGVLFSLRIPRGAQPYGVFYTDISMRALPAILVVTLLTHPGLYSAEKRYQDATLVQVQEKTNTRILYYVVDTPITKDEPYYEVSVQLKGMVYLSRYVPRHTQDTLPEEWVAGEAVEARVAGRHLFLKRPSGSDVDFAIVKRTAVKPGEKTSGAVPSGK